MSVCAIVVYIIKLLPNNIYYIVLLKKIISLWKLKEMKDSLLCVVYVSVHMCMRAHMSTSAWI